MPRLGRAGNHISETVQRNSARPFAHQQTAESKQHQPWLTAKNAPEQLRRMVAVNFAERFAGCRVQQIDKIGVVFLLEVVQGFPDQPMCVEFTAQRTKFAVLFRAEKSIGNTLRATESGDDASYGGHFYLCGGITNQENPAAPDATLDGNPFAIHGDARALPLQRLHIFLFEETLDALFRFLTAAFADDSKSSAGFIFGNEPVKVWGVVRNKPHSCGIRATIFGKPHQGLNQRDCFDGRPSGRAADSTGRTVGAHHMTGVQLFAAARGFYVKTQTARVRSETKKVQVKRKLRACLRA